MPIASPPPPFLIPTREPKAEDFYRPVGGGGTRRGRLATEVEALMQAFAGEIKSIVPAIRPESHNAYASNPRPIIESLVEKTLQYRMHVGHTNESAEYRACMFLNHALLDAEVELDAHAASLWFQQWATAVTVVKNGIKAAIAKRMK
jgi:hypothetical protein